MTKMKEKEMLAEITPIIGTPEIRAAAEILKQYRQGKANLEKRIIENDQWFKNASLAAVSEKRPGGRSGTGFCVAVQFAGQ